MRYETIQKLKDEDFKRSTGVSRAMFEKMLVVVKTVCVILVERRNSIVKTSC